MTPRALRLTVNGREYTGEAEPRKLLSDFIRDDLGLTGTHVGCEHGVCGACTILWDDQPVRSCLVFAVQAQGAVLRTVEGMAPNDTELHPIQEAFWEAHGLPQAGESITSREIQRAVFDDTEIGRAHV